MNEYIARLRKKQQSGNKVISEKEFLEAEKHEQILENIENEHDDKNSN